ncbi:MAG: hypothetical protein Q4D13_03780 [Erysipelotrichaceae bacterium]|nr:hypothetical protein [Erysipelotrichaceae bacterium]
MAKKTKLQAKDLVGLNIYHDPKLGTIFYDIFSKKGYQLINQDVPKYNIYLGIMPLSLAATYLIYYWFNISFIGCIAVFIGIWMIGEIISRYVFFYKLPVADNWKPFKKDNVFISMAKTYSVARLIVLTILLIAISVITVINANMQHMEGINLYASYIIAAGAGIFALVTLISLIVKKKNNY